jgi:hypothetical protein
LQAKQFLWEFRYETPVLDKGKQWKFDYTLNFGKSNCYYNQSDKAGSEFFAVIFCNERSSYKNFF